MNLTYNTFSFSKILGWSSSRYEIFDKCKRQYFYNYYSNFVPEIPSYKIKILKSMTSVALEVGNVVHDVLEAFLRRLMKSDSNIDEKRFYKFARQKANDYFSRKTFIEIYYGQTDYIDKESIYRKIDGCLNNFINSPIYSWLFMKAITNRKNWMIEPEGYGETRLNGVKAYCKMDFLFPVDDYVYILDWKTGKKSALKHTNQLIGYAAAANYNFKISWNNILPKIIYLYPEFNEFEIDLKKDDLENFFQKVVSQTEEMYSYCSDINKNIPRQIDKFQKTPSKQICDYCNFQELCFPEIIEQNKNEEF